ncbi:hypothetical protein [Sandarakinorhabdus sp. DWP1-3-1]|uniref:hypothetical protein n=1 Tax=Sandarakinorhabdus sp. DWP1-3-1 TaxID=2804627 RepID=UPI003CEF68FA
MPEFTIGDMASVLRRSVNDVVVQDYFGTDIARITRDEYYGSLEYKVDGVEAVFKEAPWLIPAQEVADAQELHVSAFHLHGEGHEGYAGFKGDLPGGIALGDAEADIVAKLGPPASSGGGGMSAVLKRPIPRWLKYPVGDATLHLQLSAEGRLEMATLFAPDISA